MIEMTNDLFSAMDDCKISVLVLTDLSAAFNTTDHEILLYRLHNVFGFGDTVLSWFRSYLENRTQTVVVHGKHTTFIKCHTTLSSFSSNVFRWHTDLQIVQTI